MLEWPDVVYLPECIGASQYFRIDPKSGREEPCCAMGHAKRTFGSAWMQGVFRRAYRQVSRARAITEKTNLEVEPINDSANHEDRVLLYHAAIARLGYTENQSKKAMALAAKAFRMFGVLDTDW